MGWEVYIGVISLTVHMTRKGLFKVRKLLQGLESVQGTGEVLE